MKYSVIPQLFAASLAILLSSSCSKKGSPAPDSNVSVTSLSVSSGPFNTSVTITGSGLSSTPSEDQVLFNGKSATVSSASTTQLIVKVPQGAGTGNVTVSVKNGTPVQGPAFYYQYTGIITPFAGGATGGIQDGKGSAASFFEAYGIVIDNQNNLYVSDYATTLIRKITPDGSVSTFAGTPNPKVPYYGNVSKDGKGTNASFAAPAAMAIDPSNNIYVADKNLIRKITPDGTVTTIFTGKLTNASNFLGIDLDSVGNIYTSDQANDIIMKINPSGTSNIFAYGSNNSFRNPGGLHLNLDKLYLVDGEYENKIDVLNSNGMASLIAGDGNHGLINGVALQAEFYNPVEITSDLTGSLYISDYGNKAIRQILPNGIVSTLVVTDEISSGNGPYQMVFDHLGNLYLADGIYIRKITFQ